MANLTVDKTKVGIVSASDAFDCPGDSGETINAGVAVRIDTSDGELTVANGTTAAEARTCGIVAVDNGAGTYRVVRKGYLDLGDALDSLTYDDDVYLSDTDGRIADTAGTVTKLVGTVVPGWGHTTADKLLRVDL